MIEQGLVAEVKKLLKMDMILISSYVQYRLQAYRAIP